MAAAPIDDDLARVSVLALRARLALWRGRPDPELVLPADLPDVTPTLYARIAAHVVEHGKLSAEGEAFVDRHLARAEDAAWFSAYKRELAAELFAVSGKVDRALSSLEQAVTRGLSDENWLRFCPAIEGLRGTHEFEKALAVVNERAERARHALSS